MKKYIVLAVTLIGSIALGADAQADWSWIDRIIAMIPTDATTIMVIGAALEFLLRYIPSAQPLSIMRWISDFCKHAGELCAAISIFLDKVIGQRVQKSPYYNPPSAYKKP